MSRARFVALERQDPDTVGTTSGRAYAIVEDLPVGNYLANVSFNAEGWQDNYWRCEIHAVQFQGGYRDVRIADGVETTGSSAFDDPTNANISIMGGAAITHPDNWISVSCVTDSRNAWRGSEVWGSLWVIEIGGFF